VALKRAVLVGSPEKGCFTLRVYDHIFDELVGGPEKGHFRVALKRADLLVL